MSDAEGLDDRALVQACRAGDPAAWERLLVRYQRLIYSIPRASGLRSDAAAEIFQRVALKLFQNLARLRREASLTAWVMTTTRRECMAFVRATRRRESLERAPVAAPADTPDVLTRLHGVRCEHALSLAFAQLDEPCRGLLGALYLEDPAPSYEVLARRLGRPVGSLGPTRARCLRRLRRLYERLGGVAP